MLTACHVWGCTSASVRASCDEPYARSVAALSKCKEKGEWLGQQLLDLFATCIHARFESASGCWASNSELVSTELEQVGVRLTQANSRLLVLVWTS